ncbi:MAG: hypothetical protein R2812_08355 [Gelidibacter sp.]
MNLFKQRKNKRFSYTPQHLKANNNDDVQDFRAKWRGNMRRDKKTPTLLILLIILGMVIALWLVLNHYEN